MKVSSFSLLSQALEKQSPLVVIYSKDEFEQNKVLKLLPSYELFEGSAFSKEAFFEATEQSLLFQKKSYLVIKECQLLTKAALHSLARYLAKPREDLTLLLFASEVITDETIKKIILEKGILFSLLEEKPWDKKARLVQESLTYLAGVLVDTKIVQELVDSFLHDQTALRNELDKWICYSQGEKLSREELGQLTLFSLQETIWMVGDAIFKKEREKAYQLAIAFYENSSIFALLGGLRSQVHTAIDVIQIFKSQGRSFVTKKFPYLYGSLLEKKLLSFQEYGLHALYLAKLELYTTELKAKQYPHQERGFLERLIIQLT